MMNYKGYGCSIRFDDEADIFHGEVIRLRDVVTFQGRTVNELKTAWLQGEGRWTVGQPAAEPSVWLFPSLQKAKCACKRPDQAS
jgi:hypothetical protein